MSSVPLPEFPDAETKIITEYIDIYYTGDFNGDTVADIAYIVAQNSGGSGTFYYVVAQLSTQGEYKNVSNALFIGDRIRPQTIDQSESGDLVIMYLDRAPDEALSATPTIETKKEFTIYENSLQFVE